MRNPNGFGSVVYLGKKRRKPYAARITVERTIDEVTKKSIQKYKYIGYFEERKDAIKALAKYNDNPYNIDVASITFSELYDKWSAEKYPKMKESNIIGYKSSYKACESIYEVKLSDIKTTHLQAVIDNCGKNYPTLRKIKILMNMLFNYAVQNDVINKNYAEFVNIGTYGKQKEKHPFSKKEITKLWKLVNQNEYIQIVLILIYTGLRINELLSLLKKDIHFDERYFDVVESKTSAGIRKVPIAEKIAPFFAHWLNKNGSEYFITTPSNGKFTYKNFQDSYWKPMINAQGMDHTPHATRHTTITLLAENNVNQTIIKLIVGHSGAMNITERIYTHLEINKLIEAINLI